MGLSPSTDTRIPISATALNVSMLPFLLRALVELLGREAVACKRISIIIWLNNVIYISRRDTVQYRRSTIGPSERNPSQMDRWCGTCSQPLVILPPKAPSLFFDANISINFVSVVNIQRMCYFLANRLRIKIEKIRRH